jgi:serine/threonine-protein kinase RsbW
MMVSLRSARPPSATAVQRWVVTEYTELGPLRTSLRQAIDAQSLVPGKELDDVAQRMAIVATELATNALIHGRSAAVVQLNRSPAAFVVDVADELPSVPPRLVEGRPLGAGGRGLRVTQELARDAGWYVADGRKHVWARFDIPRRIRRFQAPRISIFDLATFLRLRRRRIR